jgi:phosphoribosylamine--glycine ligase
MRVLFVSGELIAGDLAYQLVKEGCDVKLYCADKSREDCLTNMVPRTRNWRRELKWVGKDGLIVFDDIGYGKIQDDLRKQGFNVIGGSEGGDKLELEREFAQDLLESLGVQTEVSRNFKDIKSALAFLEENRSKWVFKQNGHKNSLAYVGVMEDGSDVINLLRCYQKYNRDKSIKTISLQKKVDGIEIAAGRFFNGNDWSGPICINFEHKPLFPGNVGPLTSEMGTLAWYDDNENNKLFQATLAKLKPYLKEANYKGYADINCIINGDKVTPLEATMRFGSPTNQLQSEIHLSPWKDFLMSLAKGEPFKLDYKKDSFSIVVCLAIPPFPFQGISTEFYSKNVDIFFKDKLTKEEWSNIHFEEVSRRPHADDKYYISGSNGYILFITGSGKTVDEARSKIYNLIDKIVIPKMMYRSDIGTKFVKQDQKLLKQWGWF